MDASFSRRKLLTPTELRALTERSDLRGAVQMTSHIGAIGVVAYLHALAMGSLWVLGTGFCLGVLLNFLYAAQHELSHATVFKTRRLNEVFGRLIGFVQIFPRDFDQVMHFAHHQYTQDWERDGELVREPYTLTTYLLWFLGVTYWRNRIFGVIRRARGLLWILVCDHFSSIEWCLISDECVDDGQKLACNSHDDGLVGFAFRLHAGDEWLKQFALSDY